MALKTAVAGQCNLVKDTDNTTFLGFNLAEVFPPISGIQEQTYYERQLVVGDGTVAIALGGVTTMRGFLLQVVGNGSDTVTLKHGGNSVGMTVSSGIMVFGSFDTITVATASTQGVTLKILIFE